MTDAAGDNSGKVFWGGQRAGNGAAAGAGNGAGVPVMRELALDDLPLVLDQVKAGMLFLGRRESIQDAGACFLELPPLGEFMGVSVVQADSRPMPGGAFAGLQRDGERRKLNAGMGFVAVTTQKQALRALRLFSPLVVLLEVDARTGSRARFGRILRTRLPESRLVAVGSRAAQSEFDFDDYWEPPLTARNLAQVLQRMQTGADTHIMQRGPIRLDLLTRTVATPKGTHHMTPKQCALLHLLLDNHDRVVSRRDIMRTIWDTTFMDDTRTLDVHIRWLRQRIEPDPSEPTYLRTVRGKGYHLTLEG